MDWRNIARPVIIIALAVCLVLFGVYKVKETYTGFMQEYEGTYSAGGGEKIEVTIPEDTSVKEAASILKDAGLIKYKLAFQLTKVRKDGTLTYLRPDGKTQVSVEYDEAGKPVRLEAVVLSTQHDEDVTQEQIHEDIKKYVFDPILPKDMIDAETKFFINPTGRFVIGGPHGDSGLTGRKIIVDT